MTLNNFPLLAFSRLPVPHSCAPQPGQHSTQPSTNSSRQDNNICVPEVDIMFMKTHKTASSTFLNSLFRFGENHKLKFAFPSGRNDLQFNSPEVAKVLPRDTFYITILRDPAEVFESFSHYFGRVVPLTWRIPGEDKSSCGILTSTSAQMDLTPST